MFMIVISALFKLLDLILYIGDIYSDVAFTVLLYSNCHYSYFAISIGIFVLSYVTTVLYLRFIVHYRESWVRAFLYPVYTIAIILGKFSTLMIDGQRGFEMIEHDTILNDIYLSNVKTLETMSEATFQLVLNGMVIFEYGIEDSIQIISATLSFLSIHKALADRFSFIRYNKDMGLVSQEFLNALVELVVPISNLLIIFLFVITTPREFKFAARVPAALFLLLHPIYLIIIGSLCLYIYSLHTVSFDDKSQ